MNKMTKTLLGGTVALALTVGGIALGTTASVAITALTETQYLSEHSAPAYETNDRGLTFGSVEDARTPDEEPDLILVVATNGERGYALKTDLEGPTPSSPEDAVRQTMNQTSRTIPVYESDGTTLIGEFLIDVSTQTEGKPVEE